MTTSSECKRNRETDPDFSAQTAEEMTDRGGKETWMRGAWAEMQAEGATWPRQACIFDDRLGRHIYLLEGWRDKPLYPAEPHFHLTEVK